MGVSSSFVSSAILAHYAYSGSTTSERMAREKRPLEKYAFKDGMPEEKRQRPQLARSVPLWRTIYYCYYTIPWLCFVAGLSIITHDFVENLERRYQYYCAYTLHTKCSRA